MLLETISPPPAPSEHSLLMGVVNATVTHGRSDAVDICHSRSKIYEARRVRSTDVGGVVGVWMCLIEPFELSNF